MDWKNVKVIMPFGEVVPLESITYTEDKEGAPITHAIQEEIRIKAEDKAELIKALKKAGIVLCWGTGKYPVSFVLNPMWEVEPRADFEAAIATITKEEWDRY